MTDTRTTPAAHLYDADGNIVEVRDEGSTITLYGWTLRETSVGMPYEHRPDTLYLTRRQAIELARRLFLAATE